MKIIVRRDVDAVDSASNCSVPHGERPRLFTFRVYTTLFAIRPLHITTKPYDVVLHTLYICIYERKEAH